LQDVLDKQADRPLAYVVLAQGYMDANRGPDAVALLEQAQVKFPADTSVTFELGAVLEKQKRFADAEAAFRRVLEREPDNAPTLNYLGYMLADRGERLEESVGYLKKALEIDPDNGSYLDSLGWAYFKGNQLELADGNLKRAADQLKTNSVIQDHYGELLARQGRFDEATLPGEQLAVVILYHRIGLQLIGRALEVAVGQLELVSLEVRPAEAVQIRSVVRIDLERLLQIADRLLEPLTAIGQHVAKVVERRRVVGLARQH